MSIAFEKVWAMPNGKTFTIKPIRNLVRKLCSEVGDGGVIVEPFAGESGFGTITNDLNPDLRADFHMDALEFMKRQPSGEADLVLYDPPYSITQATQLYKSFGKEKLEVSVSNMKYWAEVKNEISRVLKPGGKVLCCGWNSNGLGKGRGFDMERVLIVNHGGSKNDTICTVEKKGVVDD